MCDAVALSLRTLARILADMFFFFFFFKYTLFQLFIHLLCLLFINIEKSKFIGPNFHCPSVSKSQICVFGQLHIYRCEY